MINPYVLKMHNQYSHSVFRSKGLFAVLIAALLPAALLFGLSWPLLEHPPEYDELLHVLSARGVNVTGSPIIESGEYTRAEIYTRLVAVMTKSANSELIAARLPALVFGLLLTALVGFWCTRKQGLLAGLASAGILALAPITVHQSVLVRFYTLHALVITCIIILLYELSRRSKPLFYKSLIIVAISGLLPIAFHLHDLTKISLVGGFSAFLAVLVYDRRASLFHTLKNFPVVSVLFFLTCVFGAAYVVVELGFIDELRKPPAAWSVGRASYHGFYLGAFGFHMPFVWPLFPLLAFLACLANRRVAIFCLVAFCAALLVNSAASQKAMRYVFHIFPMMCLVWGIGFSKFVEMIEGYTIRRLSWNRTITSIMVLGVIFFSFANTSEFKRALKLASNSGILDEALPVREEPDWLLARETLLPIIDSASLVVATSGVKSLYAFGRYDYELNANVVDETNTRKDFGRDKRTGKRVIGSELAVAEIIENQGSEIFILENRMLNKRHSVPVEVVDLLNEKCQAIDIPVRSKLTSWHCFDR